MTSTAALRLSSVPTTVIWLGVIFNFARPRVSGPRALHQLDAEELPDAFYVLHARGSDQRRRDSNGNLDHARHNEGPICPRLRARG